MGDRSRARRAVALVTYATHPAPTDDDQLLVDALSRVGANAEPTVWSDPDVDWCSYDAIVVRSCWDYFLRPAEFLAWLARLEAQGAPLFNTVDVVRWNSDKTYLRDLEARGVPIVPTRWIARDERPSLSDLRRDTGWSELVVKPAISGSAHETWRSSSPASADDDARLHRMTASGDVLVQPFVSGIAEHGEWSIVFIGGEYSHSVLKRPRSGEFRVQIEHGGTFASLQPPTGVLRQAAAALAAAPDADEPTLYARVDGCVIDGTFVLMELELIEPVLFLGTSSGAADRLALAILARIDQRAAVTRQITLPTSSATSSAPRASIATPTGRPSAPPSSSRNPVSTSIGAPAGRPAAKGTKTTL
jgi:hypothetical protein